MTPHQVVLRDRRSDKYCDAVLFERINAKQAEAAEDSWLVYLAAAKVEAASAGREFAPVAHEHWKWKEKVRLTETFLPYPTMAIECNGDIQGMMLLETDGHFSRLPHGDGVPLVYINLLATAPWNLVPVVSVPRYSGVGTTLFHAAIAMSKELGFKGRIGLHALPDSEEWYEKHGLTCLGPDTAKQDLKYYELSTDQADKLTSEGDMA
jgi:hypothetical protein